MVGNNKENKAKQKTGLYPDKLFHVANEINMLLDLNGYLQINHEDDIFVQRAVYESWALHMRSLLLFLYQEIYSKNRNEKRDIRISDFIAIAKWKVDQLMTTESQYNLWFNQASRIYMHLSKDRLGYELGDYSLIRKEIMICLITDIRKFLLIAQIRDTKLLAKLANFTL